RGRWRPRLAAGRRALVLVPEITLTHQILARLRGRFGDALAVLHSGLRPGEPLEEWQAVASGEEHAGAYKNEEGFRYPARDLARLRARAAGCPVVLGSATPSLEARYAAERGDIARLVLAARVRGAPLRAAGS